MSADTEATKAARLAEINGRYESGAFNGFFADRDLRWLVAEVERLRHEVLFLEQDIETIVDAVAECLGIDAGDIGDGDGDQGGLVAEFIRQIPRRAAVVETDRDEYEVLREALLDIRTWARRAQEPGYAGSVFASSLIERIDKALGAATGSPDTKGAQRG